MRQRHILRRRGPVHCKLHLCQNPIAIDIQASLQQFSGLNPCKLPILRRRNFLHEPQLRQQRHILRPDARGVSRAKASTIGAYEYIPQPGYETWAVKNALSGADTTATAITQNDGIANIEKYAFGLPCDKPATYFDNPLFSVSVSHPAQTMAADNSSSAESVMTMKYPVNASADDISVKAYKSHDLLEWLPAGSKFDGFSGGYNLFRFDETIPRGGKVFFKLVLE